MSTAKVKVLLKGSKFPNFVLLVKAKVKEKVRCGISTKCRRRPCMAFSWEEDKLKYKMPNGVTIKKMFSQHFGHRE